MEKVQNKLVDIGRRHFINIVLPKLQAISTEIVDNMLVFVEGSVSYGFCDDYSDVDIDYYIDIIVENSILNRIRKVFSEETYWFESKRVSYGFGGGYWKFDLIVKNEMDSFWNEYNPYALNNIKQAISIWDPKSLLSVIKRRVDFYPEAIYKKVLRGLWITINDSGEYNVLESIKRNNIPEGQIYFYRALEAMLRIIYVLNNEYYPPTKWLTAGLNRLDNDFGIQKVLSCFSSDNALHEKYAGYMNVYGMIRNFMVKNESIEKECIDNYSAIFQKAFYIFTTF